MKRQKNLLEIALLCGALVALSGCTQLKSVGDWVYEAEVSTQTIDGVPVTTTNWVTKPNIEAGVTIGGQIAPQPLGGIVSTALLSLLSVGAFVRGRQWKKAAVSGVEAAQEFKAALGKSNAKGKLENILGNLKTQQKAAGTWALIKSILAKL